MKFKALFALLVTVAANAAAAPSVQALIAVEPTARKATWSISVASLESGLGKASTGSVGVITSEDLADVMRSTRSSQYTVFIGPPQVGASALQRGYELVGATQPSEPFVLVASKRVEKIDAVRGKRIYLPQQDSIYSYMARGLLNRAGYSLSDLEPKYHRIPQAGLTSIALGMSDLTVVRQSDYRDWLNADSNAAAITHVLAISEPVPGGFTIVVKKDLDADSRSKIGAWFAAPPTTAGLPGAKIRPDAVEYKRIAELGVFTPLTLPGVTRVSAAEAQALVQQRNAVLVDTRIEPEYRQKHIQGAIWAPYVEKSLKDVNFDVAVDDFSALSRLPVDRPKIFSCNGAECWKSYKAAKVAVAKGHKQVFWLRGGLPEWVESGLPTTKEE